MSDDITSAICRMASDAVTEFEQAATDFAKVVIRVEWQEDPYDRHGINRPVSITRTAIWAAGEWKQTRYERLEELT